MSFFPWLESCSEKAKQQVQGEKVQIGIIGTGSRGLFHIKHLVQMPHVEVVALCDNYRPHLEDAAQYYPKAKLYDDYRKLLENKDVLESEVVEEEEYIVPDKYKTVSGSVVRVEYEGGVNFILNYNSYAITVEYDGQEYEIAGLGFVRID